MEIDTVDYTTITTRVWVMRDPADCCQSRTTGGSCDCKGETEEEMQSFAMEFLGTDVTPYDADSYTYGWVFTFERADL